MNNGSVALPPIYEFLLWNNCNNNCKFCHQKARKNRFPGKFPDDAGKGKSIDLVTKFIAEGKVEHEANILLMGGELFDTQLSSNTRRKFYGLCDLILAEMVNGDITNLYLNTNLLYEDTSMLFNMLDLFVGFSMSHRIMFTTSCDIEYRFSSIYSRNLMLRNLRRVSQKYPNINRVANCILTDVACEFLMRDPYYLQKFEDEYGTRLNLIPYITLKDSQAPTREAVQALLLKLNDTYPNFLKNYAAAQDVNQPKVLWEYDGEQLVPATSGDSPCGHGENFMLTYKGCKDKKTKQHCFICDCVALANL